MENFDLSFGFGQGSDGVGSYWMLDGAPGSINTDYDANMYQWWGGMTGDAAEAAKMEQYTPNPTGQQVAWWERVAAYGLTRAIDNEIYKSSGLPPPSQMPTTAGQNGATIPVGGYTTIGRGGARVQQLGLVEIMLLGGLAYVVMAD